MIYVGKKFKLKSHGPDADEIWKVASWRPNVWALSHLDEYTLESVQPYGQSIEVTRDDLDTEFKLGRFELIENALDLLSVCRHQYKEYIGFTETYHYCIKCNEKA